MATERTEHQAWAESQIAALIELGVNAVDAQKTTDWVLVHIPLGENPATYIFPAEMLWEEPSSQAAIDDAAAAWMASDSVPNRFKRLLHAKQESE